MTCLKFPLSKQALSLASLIILPSLLKGELIISEFLADNSGATLTDEDGFPADWIEIHNPDDASISLQDYALTDDPDDLTKWVFPNVTLPSGTYLRVFATGKDRKANLNQLHTNFSLNAGGEYLALVRPDGSTIADEFAPEYPPQLTDISYGLGNGGPLVETSIIPVSTPLTFLVPTADIGNSWQTLGFDDSSWTSATSAVGFGYSGSVGNLIGQNGDVKDDMFNKNTSIYLRMPFQVLDPSGIGSLKLKTKVDDGFVAFLNGQEVASFNAPSPLAFDSAATASDEVNNGEDYQSYDLNFAGKLVAGENILAIQALNRVVNNNDFIFISELEGEIQDLTPPFPRGFFETPTPSSTNGAPSFTPPSQVDFSVTSQAFTETLQVALSIADPGAVIRYTTDGSLPNKTSNTYLGPLSLSGSTLIRARAFLPSSLPGPSRSEGYMKIAAGDADFSSDLPIVLLSTFGKGGPPSTTVTTRKDTFMLIYEPDPATGRASFTGTPTVATRGGFRRRGSSSANFPKYGMSFESWDENGDDQDITPFGFSPEADWILNTRYTFDLSLMRNPFLYDLSNQIGRWAVKTQFVELFNDVSGTEVAGNDYFGVYTFMEKIEGDSGRLDLSKLDPWENSAEEVTGGYIFKNDRPDPGEPTFSVSGFQRAMVHVAPDGLDITSTQKTYLTNETNELTVALRASDGIHPTTGIHFSDYLDVDSFIDHFWLNLLAMDPDWGRLSQFFHKDRGGKIIAGPLWDYDRTMGSRDSRDDNPSRWEAPTSDTSFAWFDREYEWFGLLFGFTTADDQVMNMSNPQLRSGRPDVFQKVIDRWYELRQDEFSEANLHAIVDSMAGQLNEAQNRNFTRWTALNPGSVTGQNFASAGTSGWSREVSHLKGWLTTRSDWIDDQFFSPPSFSQNGGEVTENFSLSISAGNGSVYYTTDGSDPRADGGAPSASAVMSSNAILTETTSVMARSYDGQQWSAPSTATFVIGAEIANDSNLVVSEIMYDPAGPSAAEEGAGFTVDSAFEYLEIHNTSNDIVSLAQVHFTNGIDFTFTGSNVTELAPGARALIVKSIAGFTERYGNGFASQIAGEFANGSSLSGSGERLVMTGLEGVISDITYNNKSPWPKSPDGDGPSLVFISADQGVANNWRPSVDAAGNPGTGDATIFAGNTSADNDNDGYNAFAEYALGTDDNTPDDEILIGSIDSNGRYNLTYPRNLAADDAEVILQISTDLNIWTLPGNTLEDGQETHNGDGTVTYSFRTPDAAKETTRLFGRLLIMAR